MGWNKLTQKTLGNEDINTMVKHNRLKDTHKRVSAVNSLISGEIEPVKP
jgi:hypothetical protein